MRPERYVWIAVVAGAAAAGCTPTAEQRAREDVQGVRQELNNAARGAQIAAAEAALASKVKTALLTRKGLDARQINVDVEGTQVVLRGDVADAGQAELAERVAMETQGVTGVSNELTARVPAKSVAPPSGPAPTGTPPFNPGQ